MFRKIMMLTLVAMLVINTCGFHVSAMKSGKNEISDYQKIIDKINTEYNRNFKITDKEGFIEYIVEKVSIEEFEQNLINDAKDFSQIKSEDMAVNSNDNLENSDIIPRVSVYYETKSTFVTGTSGKTGELYAIFEVVDLGSFRKFNRYIQSGYHSKSDRWYFHCSSSGLVSLTDSAGIVKYNGYWRYGPTGLIEATAIKYTFTYYI